LIGSDNRRPPAQIEVATAMKHSRDKTAQRSPEFFPLKAIGFIVEKFSSISNLNRILAGFASWFRTDQPPAFPPGSPVPCQMHPID